MTQIPAFDYDLLWGERVLRSVTNLTRRDATEFLELAQTLKVKAQTTRFPLEQANQAVSMLRQGKIAGAAVLIP